MQDVIDLTKEKQIKVAEHHAIAAKTHADGVQWQTKIAALEQAMKMGISAESLRPYMMLTLHTLFNNDAADGVGDDEDVVIVGTNKNPASGIKEQQSKTNHVLVPTTIAIHNAVAEQKIVRCGKCCSEEECVHSDGELDDDFVCYLCQKEVHDFCVITFNNHKALKAYGCEVEICYKCVCNTPSVLQMIDD